MYIYIYIYICTYIYMYIFIYLNCRLTQIRPFPQPGHRRSGIEPDMDRTIEIDVCACVRAACVRVCVCVRACMRVYGGCGGLWRRPRG